MEAIDPSCTSIPNPITALAWLPPDIASQYEAVRFFFAAVLGVRGVKITSKGVPNPDFDLIVLGLDLGCDYGPPRGFPYVHDQHTGSL